ncbi:hypothetical protein SKAU_G00191880 [Synaphobranchus kaupii]|uniref:Uncharacterized protein n=1 Tax=Synaphobranchus kaupii TaxID=118154 RepID=A0A9Q1IWG0_SYNKA|nr:hypothetical protein SKAU_G00191880 [Synaphobranchus kaupii]
MVGQERVVEGVQGPLGLFGVLEMNPRPQGETWPDWRLAHAANPRHKPNEPTLSTLSAPVPLLEMDRQPSAQHYGLTLTRRQPFAWKTEETAACPWMGAHVSVSRCGTEERGARLASCAISSAA